RLNRTTEDWHPFSGTDVGQLHRVAPGWAAPRGRPYTNSRSGRERRRAYKGCVCVLKAVSLALPPQSCWINAQASGGIFKLGRIRQHLLDVEPLQLLKRNARGEDLLPEVTGDRVVLGYRGLDGAVRRTLLQFAPQPSILTASTARLDLSLR